MLFYVGAILYLPPSLSLPPSPSFPLSLSVYLSTRLSIYLSIYLPINNLYLFTPFFHLQKKKYWYICARYVGSDFTAPRNPR